MFISKLSMYYFRESVTLKMVPMIRYRDWIINIEENSTPKKLLIEVTTYCNFNCIYCFRRNMHNDKDSYMDFSLYKKIIDEASRLGVEKIIFSGWGEPLTHPEIINFLKYAKQKKLYILLNTNGSLLKEYLRDLSNSIVDEITISVDSLEKSKFRYTRRCGDINEILTSVQEINELRKKGLQSKPLISFQFTINRMNFRELLDFIELCPKLGCYKIIVSNVIPLTFEHEKTLSCYSCEECIDFIKKVKVDVARKMLEHNINIILPNTSLKTERLCPFIYDYAVYIRYDGKVSPCIYYSHDWNNVFYGIDRDIQAVIFGDLNKSSLKEVWLDKRYVRFRFTTSFMHMPSCLDCPLMEYCLLTKSNEFDCWGNTPTCAHCPYSRGFTYCPT